MCYALCGFLSLPVGTGRDLIWNYSLRKRAKMVAICARVALEEGCSSTPVSEPMPLMMPSLVAQIIASTA